MNRVNFLLFATVLMTGCVYGSARIHYQDQKGGVMVLENDEAKAMEDAHKKMAAHCGPANYQIVKRETIVVGQEQYTSTSRGYQEEEDRARDEDTISETAGDSEYAYGEATTHESGSSTDYGPGYTDTNSSSESVTSGVGHASSNQVGTSSTREDESRTTSGVEQTDTVSGVRNVNEVRVHYVCAAAQPGPAPAPAPAPGPAQ